MSTSNWDNGRIGAMAKAYVEYAEAQKDAGRPVNRGLASLAMKLVTLNTDIHRIGIGPKEKHADAYALHAQRWPVQAAFISGVHTDLCNHAKSVAMATGPDKTPCAQAAACNPHGFGAFMAQRSGGGAPPSRPLRIR